MIFNESLCKAFKADSMIECLFQNVFKRLFSQRITQKKWICGALHNSDRNSVINRYNECIKATVL
jgi:hypothetical protein